MQFRTDLAIEAREIAGENTGGIEFKKYSENGLEISRLIVKNQKARQALGKEIGTYITIELPSLTDNFTETDKRLETVGNEIKRLLPVNGLVLVAGLGNMEITPDSLGPKASRRVLATRHIGGEIARSTGLDRLRPVAVMQTGVTGQTGIETGEYILSIVRRIRPTAVVAIDALASRRTERLGCTLQISWRWNSGYSGTCSAMRGWAITEQKSQRKQSEFLLLQSECRLLLTHKHLRLTFSAMTATEKRRKCLCRRADSL